MTNKGVFNIPVPQLQIDFSFTIIRIRSFYLQQALSETVKNMEIAKIDRELAKMVPKKFLLPCKSWLERRAGISSALCLVGEPSFARILQVAVRLQPKGVLYGGVWGRCF